MNPVSVSTVLNKNGVLTMYVLMSDGTILKKAEDENRWSEADSVLGHRNEQPSKPDLVVRNKGSKKRKDTASGKQFSRQPEKIAEKTSMPMMSGKKNIGKNLTKLKEEGYPRKQALAIALDVQRRRKRPGKS